ncbi:PQQ-binding-like beta-propeller repeat protein [Cellulomonas endophytica]|uniref:outer membrane protein assembly factor BamB family protein n=1 Tax=Cellulomonas endophytica TaxID=2494735 RepID=UPI0013E8F5A8|nr:PQQ-binding-like beta-propeller repeat protein [Cellulomonas endophytica]
MPRDDHFSEVVWDDEAPAAPAPPPWARPGRRLPRPPRWALLALAGALVATAGGALGLDRLQVLRTDARLARTEGLTVGLARPLVAAWEADGWGTYGAEGDLLLVQGFEGLVALDAATGETRWSLEGFCQGGGWPSPRLRGDVAPLGDHVLCQTEQVYGDEVARAPALTVHDARTGALVRTLPVPADGGWDAVGDLVVTFAADAERHLLVTATEPATGTVAWTYRSDAPTEAPGGWAWPAGPDRVVLDLSSQQVVLDAATGEPVDPAEEDAGVAPWIDADQPLPDGRLARLRVVEDEPLVQLVDADGTVRRSLPGLLLAPGVDDGTAPGLVVVREGLSGGAPPGVSGLDGTTGDARWAAPVAAARADVVQGVVLLGGEEGGVVALDAADGRRLWPGDDPVAEDGAPAAAVLGAATDGRSVLLPEPGTDGSRLVARDLRTGRELWALPTADRDAVLHRLPDGSVLVSSGGRLTRYVPPEG